jgi:Sap-like sulfolipid-1-addressing protein
VHFWVLALYAALYPTLLAAVVILISQPRPFRLLSAYLAGGLTISIFLGLVIVFALGGVVHGSGSGLSWGMDLTIGGLALLLAVALATGLDQRFRERRQARRPQKEDREQREPWSQRILSRGSVPIVFAAALAINVPGAAYLIALKDIAAAHASTVTSVVEIVAFNLIMFALAEIPWLGLLFAPQRTQQLVGRTDHWLSAHGRRIAMLVSAALGVFLIVRGILHSS